MQRNRVTVIAVIPLATLVRAALLFRSRASRAGNNCFRRIVQRERFSYRRFSLSELHACRSRVTLCGLPWDELYELYLNAHPESYSGNARRLFSFHRDCYTAAKYYALFALDQDLPRHLIIPLGSSKTFPRFRYAHYHIPRVEPLRGHFLYVSSTVSVR